eukprot:403368796
MKKFSSTNDQGTQNTPLRIDDPKNQSIVQEVKRELQQKEELKKYKVVIHTFPNDKDMSPNTIEIDRESSQVTVISKNDRISWGLVKNKIYIGLFETFLPVGYPNSVAEGYLKFSIFNNLSALSITAMSFLSAQSLFVAIGSTMTQANLAAAAYTWVLKDGIGQLGAILFASRYGRNFDEDIKKWRFMAMIALNISIYIEILTLRFPNHFLALASIANIGKNICFLLSAASRASINVQFAKRNNIGDISGKSVSQFTASTLCGVGIGLMLSKLIDISSISQLYPVFMILTILNIATSYQASKVIDEVYLNNQRAFIIFNEYFKSNKKNFLTVEEGNIQEIFYMPNYLNMNYCKFIKFGHRTIGKVLATSKPHYYTKSVILQLEKNDRNFVYHVKLTNWYTRKLNFFTNNGRKFEIHLNMSKNATNFDIMKAYYFARLLDEQLFNFQKVQRIDANIIEQSIKTAEIEFQETSFNEIELKLKQHGWSLDYIYLDPRKNRYSIENIAV